MHYIAVNYPQFWDKVEKNEEASLSKKSVKIDVTPLSDKTPAVSIKTPAVFIKMKEGTSMAECAWNGYVYNVYSTGEFVKFKIEREGEIPNPTSFNGWEWGWYTKDTDNSSVLFPPFFEVLRNTEKWEELEDYTYMLFRVMGVHTIYKWDKKNQSGRAYGFFKFKNLAVIYDCTLNSDFEKAKGEQIQNYCNKLKGGSVELDSRTIEKFHTHQKQVWIITRGQDRLIGRTNDIAVKEITIDRLIKIYESRLLSAISEEELENQFRNISSKSQ